MRPTRLFKYNRVFSVSVGFELVFTAVYTYECLVKIFASGLCRSA